MAFVLAAFALVSCEPAEPAGPVAGKLEVRAAPLSLGPITDAVYQVTVFNDDGDIVWSRDISSTAFGDGAGAISYVGTCDPAANPNRVELVVVSLSSATGPLSFANPAPPEDPLVELVDCLPNEDVAVSFEFTAAVAAEQGFFDVAISFDDIFCSAKFDCLNDDDETLELLFNPITGERDRTAVLGFACTAGPGQDTYLWMDPIEILCSGGGPFDINTAGGPGNLDPYFPGPVPDYERLIFQAAVYRGVELLDAGTSWNKAYWNVAIGLNEDAFELLDTCVLHGLASASNGDFNIGQTPPNVRWPAVQWTVPLVEGGVSSCGRYELDAGDEVKTIYTGTDGHRFYASYRAETGELEIQVGTPDASTVVVCADETLNPGEQTLCSITPRQDGLLVPVEPADFDGLSASAGSVTQVQPQELSTSFTFTFTAPPTSQVVTIDTGVGATTTVTVLGTPDNSTTLSCADTLLLSGESTVCTITPMAENVVVAASASNYSPGASPDGTVSAIAEPYGTALHFTYTAGVTTGTMTITDGAAAFTTLTVYATPDATSTVSCVDDRLKPGTTTVCTIIPRANGVQILAVASDFDVTVSPDGGIGGLSPALGTSFSFVFTAPGTVGDKVIDVGFHQSQAQTTIEVYSDIDPEDVEPPGPPIIVDAGPGDRQIYLDWIAPTDNGGSPNLVYTAICTAVDGNGPDGSIVTASLTAIILWLENGKEYTCIVYATNESGNGPPSDPTAVIIPVEPELAPGIVVAAPLTLYSSDTFGAEQEPVGGIVGAPMPFFGEGVVSPFDPSDSGAVVAVPITVYQTDHYDGYDDETYGVVNGVLAPFTGDRFVDDLGLSSSGAVVAAAVSVYHRTTFDEGVVGETSTINASAAVLLANGFTDAFGESFIGAIVAAPLDVYAADRFDDGTSAFVGMLVAAPSAFLGGGFTSLFGQAVSGAVVAPPLSIFAVQTFAEPSGEVGVANADPAPFRGSELDDHGASTMGAVVAPALSLYGSTSFLDPTPAELSAIVAAPSPFAEGDPEVLGPLGPPTITSAWTGDGTIYLVWDPPVADGGSAIVSYTMTCTRTDDSETATNTIGFTSGEVTGLTNDVAYTCTVHATNGNGTGPESDPTTLLYPTDTPSFSGAVVATPLTVFRDGTFFDRDAAVGVIGAPPAAFGADGFAADLGAQGSGAVVAASLTVYATHTFDAERGVETSVVLADPGVFDATSDFGGDVSSGAVVAPPLMIGSVATFSDPTVETPDVGVIVDAPRTFSTAEAGLSTSVSGAIVATPLSLYRVAVFSNGANAGVVSTVASAPGPFTTVDPSILQTLSGPVVARPLTLFAADAYLTDEQGISAIVARPGVFGADTDGVGVATSGPVVATPMTLFRTGTFGQVGAFSAIVGKPAPFADDGSVTAPPGPPVITDASAGDLSLELTWDPPAESGGQDPATLVYTVVCTDAHGPTLTVETMDTTVVLDGAQAGHDYYCTVTATNLVGDGPPSDEVGPLTPVSLHDRSGAVVATPLTLFSTDRQLDAATRVSAIVAAPAAFGRDIGSAGASLSGAVVAVPMTVYGGGVFSTEPLAMSAVVAPSAAFTSAGDDLGARSSGAVVATALTLYSADTAIDGAHDGAEMSAIVAPVAPFLATSDGLGGSASGAVVATPLAVYRAQGFTASAGEPSVITAAPAAFAEGDDHGASASGAVVAVPLSIYRSQAFNVTDVGVGPLTALPAPFGDGDDEGLRLSGAVVAAPLSLYATGSYLFEAPDAASAVVAAPAAFADDEGLLPGGVTAPVIYAAEALDEAAWLAWRAPEDDGGSAIVDYTVTCESAIPADTVSATFTDLDGVIGGLTNGYTYTCVVYANHADTTTTASFPSLPLTPESTSNLAGAVVAPTWTVYTTGNYLGPVEEIGVVAAAPGVFDTFGQDLGQQTTGAVVASALTVYSAGTANSEPDVVSMVTAPPGVFSATETGDIGLAVSGAVVAAPLTVYGSDVFAVDADPPVTAVIAAPAVYTGVVADSPGASTTGAIVAAPWSIVTSQRFTAQHDGVGAIVAAPAAFSASVAGDLGQMVTGAVVAPALTVYATQTYYEPPTTVGVVAAAPAVWLATGAELGQQTSGAIAAATLTVYSATSYPTSAPLLTGPVVAPTAPWLEGLVYIDDVAPADVSRAATSDTLVLSGFPLAEVTSVAFYAPGASVTSPLVSAGAPNIGAFGDLVVPITIDPSAPLGIWQVQVSTAGGAASPIEPEASQKGYTITFTLSD